MHQRKLILQMSAYGVMRTEQLHTIKPASTAQTTVTLHAAVFCYTQIMKIYECPQYHSSSRQPGKCLLDSCDEIMIGREI